VSSSYQAHLYPRLNMAIFYSPARIFHTSLQSLITIDFEGVRVYSHDLIPIGEKLIITLFFPDETELSCTVRVVWSQMVTLLDSAPYEIGLEFLDIPQASQQYLNQYLQQLETV